MGNVLIFLFSAMIHIKVSVFPESRKEEIKRISKDKFVLRVKESPEKGKANLQVKKILKKFFPENKIELIKGGKSKNKIFKIYDAS